MVQIQQIFHLCLVFGWVAQLVEHGTENPSVVSSTLTPATIILRTATEEPIRFINSFSGMSHDSQFLLFLVRRIGCGLPLFLYINLYRNKKLICAARVFYFWSFERSNGLLFYSSFSYISLERWVSGLNQFPAKEPIPLRGPRVRIPPSPPLRRILQIFSLL